MPDVPVLSEPEPENDFAAKLVALRNRLGDAARVTITGTTQPVPIRRKVLFAVTAVSIFTLLGVNGVAGLIVGGIGLIALLFLAMTDDVVDL